MDEMSVNGTVYISTKKAAEITGYTTDYVGQLARGNKVSARLVGRNWFIDRDAILKQKFGTFAPSVASVIPETPSRIILNKEESPVEEVVTAPIIPQEEIKPSEIVKNVEEKRDPRQLLNEMQSAWNAWHVAHGESEESSLENPLKEANNEEDISSDMEKEGVSVNIPIRKEESIEGEREIEAVRVYEDPFVSKKGKEVAIRKENLPMKSPFVSVMKGFAVGALLLALGASSWAVFLSKDAGNMAGVLEGVRGVLLGTSDINRD